ncbi:hypothetical protein C8F04DRAFT_100017 [Mycena alexandri]|uniref:Protein kinase domain-containing protein n=1 Tax=Mycena alexandri TaxID=1745969 RepID=A0AAD6SH25_9AGAR|nr:hypothetical protein C8F04DRAFT_100017 [Mycena alexandri]
MSLEVPTYEFRNLDLKTDCESDIAHHQKMARRKLALQAPLYTGLEFTLALEPPRQNPNARKLPRVPSLSPTALQLRDELQRGIDGFSQVWTAVCGDDPETCLVLKIIQPSICRGIPLDPTEEYFEPWDLAHNEAWVYRHLAHYQGLLIPYFFGLSTIVTPCGEEAWVLVFEFIPGLTVNGVADSGSISDIREFCALGVRAVGDFVRGGWVLRDIRPPNFILTRAPGAWAVVIIDLFLCEPLESTTNRKLLASYQAQSFLSRFVLCVEDVDKDVYPWAEKNLPAWVLPPSGDEEEEAID